MRMQMTPGVTVVGSSVVFAFIVVFVVYLPLVEGRDSGPSETWRELTEQEQRGREIYIANGCQYCHSQYVRPQDWDYGHNRIAEAGDYFGQEPPLLGSERQGPDLSQEGGLHSNGWHWAHFINPRFTRPDSIMPPFRWMSGFDHDDMSDFDADETAALIAHVQSLGGADADLRMDRQERWRPEAWDAYAAGAEANLEWLHDNVPDDWMTMPNPYPATEFSLARGENIYQHYCIGCHGPVGDGVGPAGGVMLDLIEHGLLEEAPPYNFTFLTNWDGPLGGMIYYQVMNGITGTSMPAFKHELESEKIWDVSNYIAVSFAGRGLFEEGEHGIPASYEPPLPGEPGHSEEAN